MTVSSFKETLRHAVLDIALHGFDSQIRVDGWMRQLRLALIHEVPLSEHIIKAKMDQAMGDIYSKLITKPLKIHPGIEKFTREKVRPELHAELTRRIQASANLIKLNREEMIEKTMRRFQGWATSVPPGGSSVVDKRDIVAKIYKPLSEYSYEERRVAIDQGHKLTSNIHYTIAQGGNAIAGIWHSRFRQAGYNYRPDHKERDGVVYLLKNNWAKDEGLVKPGEGGYLEDHEMAGEAIFCRCTVSYLYSLRQIPDNMLTAKGRERLGK